jgi:UDPglucose 6-dehydrogenase
MAPYKISIVGTGYVGLCTAAGFASKGYEVITSTHNPEKVDKINRGIPPFFESHLEELLKEAVSEGHLRCVLGRTEAIQNTEMTFVAVGTPSQPDGRINLQHIQDSAREIGEALAEKNAYHLVVIKSTVVPGTTQNVVKPILEKESNKSCGKNFGLCMSPEFLREGSAVYDTLHPDRVVIGEHDKTSGDVLETLSREFYSEELPPILRTNLPTAELIKYANNAFLATKISFINQIANICEKTSGTDVNTVANAIGLDKRIGPLFLKAGLGYGGSCFPKDVKALIAFSSSLGYDPVIIRAVENVNRNQPYKAVELAKKALGDLKGKRIAVLGLCRLRSSGNGQGQENLR